MPANYVLLERIELNASAASVVFANIPQSGYTDLKVVTSYRTNRAQVYDQLRLTFNGSSTAVYSFRGITGDTGVASESSTSVASIKVAPGGGNNATANTFTNDEIYIPNYTSNTNKSLSSDAVGENNAAEAYKSMFAGLWANTAAINSITFTPEGAGSFLANSTFSLYGLAAVGTTPVIAPKASGGNRIDNDGTYWYHTFTSTGAFVPATAISADVLVIAGGGGGGGTNIGGGGGAGGLLYSASQSLAVGSYTCTVGAGGAGSTTVSAKGTNGVNSQFGSITASVGGGGGGSSLTGPGASGGSGGGGSNAAGSTGGSATSGQGFAGGTSNDGGMYPAGGGGGSGAVGSNGNGTNNGRPGGTGINTYSSWASATSTGSSGFYAGGGSGGAVPSSGGTLNTTRSNGGGGFNSTTASDANGLVNTGSGGTGFSFNGGANTYPAGAGGSGVVIIRYTIA